MPWWVRKINGADERNQRSAAVVGTAKANATYAVKFVKTTCDACRADDGGRFENVTRDRVTDVRGRWR